MRATQPTLPSDAHLCLCNYAKQDWENQRLLAYRSTPKLVDRTIGPRFEMAGLCPSHKRYEPPAVVPRVSAAAAMSLAPADKRARPSRAAAVAPRTLDGATVQAQYAELVAAESQLTGYDRSSTYNFRGRLPGHETNATAGPNVGTTGRVPIRGMRPWYAPNACTDPASHGCKRAQPVGPNTAESVPTVPTRLPVPPLDETTSTPQACTNCTPRFDVFTGCEGEDCPMSLGSAQARPPTMQGAPKCPEPHLAEQGQWWHWKGTMPEARKECWQWNDHPYELGVYGVARKAGCEVQGRCCQDLFGNNTRRKLVTGTVG